MYFEKNNNKIFIGEIRHGVCRHKSLLFKFLCDKTDIDCVLIRGDVCGYENGGHAWNIVNIDSSNYMVDVRNYPGKLKSIEKIKYDALKIAEVELESNILPISIKKPFPKKTEEELKRAKKQKLSDKAVEEKEQQEEQEIAKEGEIMELANPEDEQEDEASQNPVVEE